ncbi:class I SAM-dependent methyltransferase [Aurantimonas endophytica]|uniref:Methyltransferase family protein n=1 Tax=Aurantimonas endophytica TaxID=1522175 RepID=A0A7W6HGM7_9HYPH|nr:methyltransferase domain-containing protein [Aurantimonas endophytica]MBB4004823.1 hypothetical protein [Aurantimonas endophytica]MCO6405633.1 hypothetical protein [Aurantimonas endophytica]
MIKRAIKKAFRAMLPQRHDADGRPYYTREGGANAGLQSYYVENKAAIHRGHVPDRYRRIAGLVPGQRIIEFGSADGTQSLVLALAKDAVCGVELMDLQFEEAERLKSAWLALGRRVENCAFLQASILESTLLLNGYDTVLMSRVLYHLRSDIDGLMGDIAASDVKHVVLVGCPSRTERWRKLGETGDSMGKFAYYATPEGMSAILEKHGFKITTSLAGQDGNDPVVVGAR